MFAGDRFGFRDLLDPARMPVPLHNPKRIEVLRHFEEARGIGPDTELLLYFVARPDPARPSLLLTTRAGSMVIVMAMRLEAA